MAAKPSVPSTPAAASAPPPPPASPAPLQKQIGPTPTTPATPAAATPAAATPAAATPSAATPSAATPAAATPAARLNEARNAGAVIEGDQITPHPDQKGGFLHHTGFALPTFRDVEQDPHIPYRDDHGKQHKIYARDIHRITDPSGKTSYQFMVGGEAVTVPEDSKAPIFQVDPAGKRFTQAADGTPRQIGIDPNAAAQNNSDPDVVGTPDADKQKLAKAKVNEQGVIENAVQGSQKHDLKKDGSGGHYDALRPDWAEPLNLREANEQFLLQQYPEVPAEDLRRNYNAYRDDYVSRNYDLPDGVDDKTFHHLYQQKLEQRSRVDGAAGAGVSSAMTSGQKLQAMAEWVKSHPNAGKEEQAAWGRTYDHVRSLLDPYRSAVHKALDGGEHEQGVLLDTLADLPELQRELLMRYAASVAQRRGKNHMLGVADTVGASAQRTLTDMFTSVSRIPPSLKKQVEDGQTSFKGPITSVVQALEALSADLQDPRHSYYKRVQQAGMLPLRPLSEEEKSIMAQALQREKKRNGLALTMRSILNESEPLNDSILSKMAAGLGSSLPLVLAATPQGMLAAGAGYANADFHEIMAGHPEMDEDAAGRVALVSGAVKAGLDKLSLFGLGKLAPNVARVLSGQATSQMVKNIALQAGAAYGFENIQEGLQDLTRPAVQSLAASLGQDIQGVDWHSEMKKFWGSRLDVALGVLPLTLLGIGHNTLQNRQSVLEILNNDKALRLAGLVENDRAAILKAAQSGDAAKSETLLQAAWNRRDPAVAAAAIQETDGAQHGATQHLNEQKGGASDQSPPPENNGQPSQSTSSDQQSPRSFPTPEENSQALDGIARLKEKAEAGELSPEEKLELDQHEKTRAATRVHHLEAEQETLGKLNPPRELDSFKAQALKDERAILQRPAPGDPPAPPSQPSIPGNTTETGPESVHSAPERLPSPEENSKALDGIARLEEKAKSGELSPEEKLELDQHEKTRAATRVHHLEAEQEALSELNPPSELDSFKAQALKDERAILQRPAPGTLPTPNDYPHATDGDYRGNWKISVPGRRVKLENGQEGVVTAVAKDHTLTVNVGGESIAGVPQHRVKMQLTPDELAAEQAFIKRHQSFQKLKPVYDQRLNDIAKSLPEAHVILAPLKGAPRALEKAGKAANTPGPNGKSPSPEKVISQLTDVLRGSIVVDSLDQVPQATSALLRSFAPDAKQTGTTKWGAHIYQTGDGRKVIINDRFKNPTAEGYSDVQIMLEMTPGHMVEIQIHIPEMLAAKEGDAVKKMGLPEKYWPENLPINGFDPKRTGHHMYEEKRSLPEESANAGSVAQEMKSLYQAAMDAHFKRKSRTKD